MDKTENNRQRQASERKSRLDDTEFGCLLRGAMRAISGFQKQEMAEIEEFLSQELGVARKTLPNYYKGKGFVDEGLIVRLLTTVANMSRRAYLDRNWASDLISAAQREHRVRYRNYDPDELLDRLWPQPVAAARRPALPAIPSNIPATTYAEFVDRPEPFAAVVEGLKQRSALVVIVGMGGIGKTSLAREVADRCLQPLASGLIGDDDLPRFAAVVWYSDKSQPGKTTLSALLNEIAYTLDYVEFTHLDMSAKRRAVERLLRSQRVLLVLDNAETIADPAIFDWLLHIPEPSKALMTSREYHYELTAYVCRVDLGRLSASEGQQFIALRSQSIQLLDAPDAETQEQLVEVTGGNPRAIEMLLGLAKRSGRSVADLVRSFGADQSTLDDPISKTTVRRFHELLDALFLFSWHHLSTAEQQVMLALTLLPDRVADTLLSRVTGLNTATCDDAMQQLADLALVETEQRQLSGIATHQPRRGLHPLTRQFARSKLAADPDFAATAGECWLSWALEYAQTYGGHRPNDPLALGQIAAEEPILWAALEWAVGQQQHAAVVQLARQLEFFYYLRARWDKKRILHEHYIAAAEALDDLSEQITALTMHIILLSRQGQEQGAQSFIAQLQQLEHKQTLHGHQFFNTRHAQALYHRARGDLDAAAQVWQDVLDLQEARAVSAQLVAGTQHWLGLCRLWQGHYAEAQHLLTVSLETAQQQGNTRRIARNHIALALLDLEQGQLDAARQQLLEREQLAEDNDEEQRAHLLYVQGRLLVAEGDQAAAQIRLAEALHLFERMGLAAETEMARSALGGF